MNTGDYIRLKAQIAILKEIALDYKGKTIDNIIRQLESIAEDAEDNAEDVPCCGGCKHFYEDFEGQGWCELSHLQRICRDKCEKYQPEK